MTLVLQGFASIGALIALGAFLAQVKVLDLTAQHVLSTLAFYVATPAVLIVVLHDADLTGALSVNLAAAAASAVGVGAVYLLLARFVFHQKRAEATVGALCSGYVNAGNLGLPVAAYVLGDAALVAPTLLLQTVVLQPAALMVLDVSTSEGRPHLGRLMLRPLRTPLCVAALIGVVLAATKTPIPDPVLDPLTLLSGMAVPGMLLAYGVALRLGPRPGAEAGIALLGTISALKLVLQPLLAFLVARSLDASDDTTLTVVVLAALPTAQNVFVHATRYRRGMVLARDAIFLNTVLSVPVIMVVAALLG